jgi:hypothetical protein
MRARRPACYCGPLHGISHQYFLQVADYYLVAQAHAWNYVVVTHERADHAVKRIKIPNVCIELGLKCMTPFEMLRLERARFVLGTP